MNITDTVPRCFSPAMNDGVHLLDISFSLILDFAYYGPIHFWIGSKKSGHKKCPDRVD
jgi:hypothetical protein